MPDVGLLTFTEPLPANAKVVIKYSVEVNGLPVYNETYDVKVIEAELKAKPTLVKENWVRRILCAVCCQKRAGFSACLTRCLADGECCEKGHENCQVRGRGWQPLIGFGWTRGIPHFGFQIQNPRRRRRADPEAGSVTKPSPDGESLGNNGSRVRGDVHCVKLGK